MDIKDLSIFKTVAAFGNITKAAEHLNYAQSNVTARINQLEHELNVDLFIRNSRGVVLTNSGETLLNYANRMISLQDELVGVLHDGTRGRLKIGVILEVAAVRLPYIMRGFKEACPNIELITYIESTEVLLGKILNYELDGIFVDGPIKNDELVQEICIDDELVLITGQQLRDSRKLELICKNDLITVSQNCIYKRRFEQWVQSENTQLPKSIQVGTWEGIFASVELDLGFAITIRSLAEKYVKSHSFFIYDLPKAYNQNPLVFLRRKDRMMTKTFQTFLDISSQKTILSS
jgi:DNA-binding transcriptional LysR family regulator